MCMKKYEEYGLNAVGKHIPENEQPAYIYKLLNKHNPDILVITGHDGMLKKANKDSLDNYRNSRYFMESVSEARRFERNMDNLVVFAGACQSMFSSIMSPGANFGSSPERVLIHALDPVIIARIVATTPHNVWVSAAEAIKNTITGAKGIGGIDTKGMMRYGFGVDRLS